MPGFQSGGGNEQNDTYGDGHTTNDNDLSTRTFPPPATMIQESGTPPVEDYQVYKIWLRQPGDLPDHVTLAVVQSHLPHQDYGTLYHITGNIYSGFRRAVDENRHFGTATNFIRKQHVFGMSDADYSILRATCQAIPVPLLGEYNTMKGPEEWVDSVVFKYKNEVAFQKFWKSCK